MRPVFRGASPQAGDYNNYRDAFDELAKRIDTYCSYCERRIATNLAVEHIQPKALPAYENLKGRWDNFLLGCVNCNSTKGKKDVVLAHVLLPDRDNTAAAYEYAQDGSISIPAHLTQQQQNVAARTLALVGLDKYRVAHLDSNERLVATDLVDQRIQTWLIAQDSKNDLQANPNDAFRRQIARAATGHGFFSIWMTVFSDDIDLRKLLIAAFRGTAVDCYDANTRPVKPRPANGLAYGSKA